MQFICTIFFKFLKSKFANLIKLSNLIKKKERVMETSLIDNIFAWCLIVAVILLSWLIIRLSLLLDSHQDRLEETLNKIEKSLIEKK